VVWAWVLIGALVNAGLAAWAWWDYRRRVARAFDPHPPGCLCERCMPNVPRFG